MKIKHVKKISEIDTSTEEGMLLLMAIGKLTCTIYSDRTPDSVLKELRKMCEKVRVYKEKQGI